MEKTMQSTEEVLRVIEQRILTGEKYSISQLAREYNIPRTTLQDRIKRAQKAAIEFPEFVGGDESLPIEEIRRRAKANYEMRRRAAEQRNWFTIKLQETKPYGFLWFGDPHVDDDGANWSLLEKHIEFANMEGIYCGNIGDTTNRWVGRLIQKYADQSITWTDADRLAEWFMKDSGCTWLVWLLGNHDLWNRGADFYRRIGAPEIPILNWRAKFQISHPTGAILKVDASHGRKGKSIYNELHGTLRDAMLGEEADLYVTGHTHNYAMEHLELAHKRKTAWLLQLRGYKEMDDYALINGFPECQHGAAILVIVDPRKGARNIISHCFEDIEMGVEYLQMLRGKE